MLNRFTKVARKELQKLSAEKLKEKGLAWVPKGRIQSQKNYAQASGAIKANERRFKKQLLNWSFAPNHQCYQSWHHSYSLPMLMWNSSPSMHGYLSAPYFDPWCGSLCYGGLPNYFTYR